MLKSPQIILFPYFARLCLQSQIKILNAHVSAQGRRINETANKVSPSKNVKCQDTNNFLIIMTTIELIIMGRDLRPTPLLTLSWNKWCAFYSHQEHHFVKKGWEREVTCASNRCENTFSRNKYFWGWSHFKRMKGLVSKGIVGKRVRNFGKLWRRVNAQNVSFSL